MTSMRKLTLWGGGSVAVVLLIVGLVVLSPQISRGLSSLPADEGEPPPPGPQAVDETRPFTASGEVKLEATSGRLVVEGWERPEIAVSGSLEDGSKSVLSFETDGDFARLAVEDRPRHGLKALFSSGGGAAELTVHVPRGSSVEVRTASSEVTVDRVDGAVIVHTTSGAVTVSGTPSRLEVVGVSGEIGFSGRTSEIHARSVSGGVRLQSEEIALLGVDTVSGPVAYSGSLAAGADVDVETVSGNVDLTLPPDVAAEFELRTRGAIESDLGPPPHDEGPSEVLDFVHGEGGGRVRVESAGGVLSLHTTSAG